MLVVTEVAKKKHEPGPIGRRVRALRDTHGWTQTELADMVGVKRLTIARIETNSEFNPSLELLQKLAGAFDVTVADLVMEVPSIPSKN